VVYAAGGITPDVLVKNTLGDSKLLTQLLARSLFFNFGIDYLSRHRDVPSDFTVTPAIRDEFFHFAEKSGYLTAEELQRQWQEDPNHNLVDLAIRVEIVNSKFGLEAGRKVQVSGDMQVQKAMTLFGEAARIAALPKKSNTAERSSKSGG